MKSTLYATREYLHKNGGRIVAFAASVAIVAMVSFVFTSVVSAQTYTTTTTTTTSSTLLASQMGLGARGSGVTTLQTFLAANSSFYPQGLVTGYFGSLTQAAVQRFQAFYGIVSSGTPGSTGYGRVGPTTLAKINSLIGGTTVSSGTGPMLFNVNTSQTSNSVTFTLNTDKNTLVRVAYGTSPLMFNEGDINSNGFGPIGGLSVNSPTGMTTSHSTVVPNLNANTIYYFTVIATDASGNVSVWGPNNSIRTSQ